jgi:PKD repeat protein
MKKHVILLIVSIMILSSISTGTVGLRYNFNETSEKNNCFVDDVSVYEYELKLEGTVSSRDWTIVATYPIPQAASGLAYDGTYLYCGIYGSNGDQIYQIDPDDGSYSLLFNGPQDDAFGLSFDGTYLWTTDHPGSSSTPAIAIKLDWNGNSLEEFDLPAHYVSGIAYDDGNFWVSQYYPDPSQIYKVTNSGSILQQFTAPDNQPWDLCIENENLWMADYWGDALYKIDPNSGELLETYDSEGIKPSGIVWDGQYLWYCDNGFGYNENYLYKIDLGGSGTPSIDLPVDFYDFGTVCIGESAIWNAVVKNIGTGNLIINDIVFSGLGSSYLSCITELPISLPAGNQTEISIGYEPLDVGALNAIATLQTNDPLNPEVDITLVGNGVNDGPFIFLPTDSYNFGSTRLNSTSQWIMDIQNFGNSVLTITEISSDDSQFYIDMFVEFPITIDVLETVSIEVWFQPTVPEPTQAILSIVNNDLTQNPYEVSVQGSSFDSTYPIGDTLWQYTIDTSYDNSPKAIAPISDITGDGIDDVIICSEDNFVRCLNGNSDGYADMIWEHELYAGSVYMQEGLSITHDVNGDGFDDVVVASAWGGKFIRSLCGKTGEELWTHYTTNYGNGGWVYSVDCSYDFNGDGIYDVIASSGDDSNDQGPKRIYCLDGITGNPIWECPVGGPAFMGIAVEDFTGDGCPDVVAGASNQVETIGYAYGINGVTGAIEWSFSTPGTSVWAIRQIDDISGDGIKDVIIGDFGGNLYGLDASNGQQQYHKSIGYSAIITRLILLDDVNGDDYSDILVGHSTSSVVQVVDGLTGDVVWTKSVSDQPWNIARIADITGDGINDVLVGTLYSSNYVYFLDGIDGSEIHSISFGTPVDAIASIPDVVGDYSWEMVVGGRNGQVFCFSGGLGAVEIDADFIADVTEGYAPLTVHFTDLSSGENPIISWEWDFTGDGIIDSQEQHPVWTYDSPGVYTVSLKISDGIVSNTQIKKDYIVVYEIPGSIEIGEVSGGLMSVKTNLINSGVVDVTQVNWSIAVNGNFVMLGSNYSDVISEIPSNDAVSIMSRPVFGVGRVSVTITAEAFEVPAVSKTVNGFLLFFLVIISE